MVNNLHSLLSGKWFIEPSLVSSMFPLLQSVIAGTITASTPIANQIITNTGAVVLGSKDTPNPSAADKYVAVVGLKNPIYKYNQECGPRGTKHAQAVVQFYMNDPFCAGVVLDIDSGGGQVSGTPEFHDFLKEAGKKKPIHAYTDGYMCSAAYYIGSAANEVFANKRADAIGSIGTMIYGIDFTGKFEKEGAKVISAYATKSTDKNAAFNELLAGNPERYIKEELDPITETFIADIKNARENINESVFTGSTYNAQKAKKMGLIDTIGTLQDAVDSIFTKTKNTNKNNNSNMSKATLTALCGVLAIEALATTDNGSYMNEEQLQTVEDSLNERNATIETLTASVAVETAAKEAAETALATSNTTMEEAIDTMLGSVGMEATGTLVEKIATLTATVEVLGKKPGTAHTDAKGNEQPKKENDFIDPTAEHNKMANELFK